MNDRQRTARRRRHHRKRKSSLNSDLFDSDSNEDREERDCLSPDSRWRQLQYRMYLRQRMRQGVRARNSVWVDTLGRPVTLAERIIRFKVDQQKREQKHLEPEAIQNPSNGRPTASSSLGSSTKQKNQDDCDTTRVTSLHRLLEEYTRQREREASLSSELLQEIVHAKEAIQTENGLQPGTSGSASISLGDSATNVNAKTSNRPDCDSSRRRHSQAQRSRSTTDTPSPPAPLTPRATGVDGSSPGQPTPAKAREEDTGPHSSQGSRPEPCSGNRSRPGPHSGESSRPELHSGERSRPGPSSGERSRPGPDNGQGSRLGHVRHSVLSASYTRPTNQCGDSPLTEPVPGGTHTVSLTPNQCGDSRLTEPVPGGTHTVSLTPNQCGDSPLTEPVPGGTHTDQSVSDERGNDGRGQVVKDVIPIPSDHLSQNILDTDRDRNCDVPGTQRVKSASTTEKGHNQKTPFEPREFRVTSPVVPNPLRAPSGQDVKDSTKESSYRSSMAVGHSSSEPNSPVKRVSSGPTSRDHHSVYCFIRYQLKRNYSQPEFLSRDVPLSGREQTRTWTPREDIIKICISSDGDFITNSRAPTNVARESLARPRDFKTLPPPLKKSSNFLPDISLTNGISKGPQTLSLNAKPKAHSGFQADALLDAGWGCGCLETHHYTDTDATAREQPPRVGVLRNQAIGLYKELSAASAFCRRPTEVTITLLYSQARADMRIDWGIQPDQLIHRGRPGADGVRQALHARNAETCHPGSVTQTEPLHTSPSEEGTSTKHPEPHASPAARNSQPEVAGSLGTIKGFSHGTSSTQEPGRGGRRRPAEFLYVRELTLSRYVASESYRQQLEAYLQPRTEVKPGKTTRTHPRPERQDRASRSPCNHQISRLPKLPCLLPEATVVYTVRDRPTVAAERAEYTVRDRPTVATERAFYTVLDRPTVAAERTVYTVRDRPTVAAERAEYTVRDRLEVAAERAVYTVRDRPEVAAERAVYTVRDRPTVAAERAEYTVRDRPAVTVAGDRTPVAAERRRHGPTPRLNNCRLSNSKTKETYQENLDLGFGGQESHLIYTQRMRLSKRKREKALSKLMKTNCRM
ncbi:P-selectin glycoprotein ligand 1 [Elysia marginata]|uniref:P-selectin glycoprotein ligand 1 n=1 Tax=Elysia marginata TaxID=1093978 RepID=A0AAV4GTE5_9GAST|nr:P-selectin glycoprotein ligand 1 [Elysia marginata]